MQGCAKRLFNLARQSNSQVTEPTIQEICIRFFAVSSFWGCGSHPCQDLKRLHKDNYDEVYLLLKNLALGDMSDENLTTLSEIINNRPRYQDGYSPGEMWLQFLDDCSTSLKNIPTQHSDVLNEKREFLINILTHPDYQSVMKAGSHGLFGAPKREDMLNAHYTLRDIALGDDYEEAAFLSSLNLIFNFVENIYYGDARFYASDAKSMIEGNSGPIDLDSPESFFINMESMLVCASINKTV